MSSDAVLINSLKVSTYIIPTDLPEADGTIEWNSTTMVLVEIEGGNKKGIGYTYAHAATALVIEKTLKELVVGEDILQLSAITKSMIRAIRNNGTCGIATMAISAVDNALWDLKAKILNVPLASLLGMVKNEMVLYGSGGFTTYTDKQLEKQFIAWADKGIKYMKMKIGTHPEKDVARVKAAKKAIGEDIQLYVDANGAYTVKQAIEMAKQFEEYNVTWFEEPVTSDNLNGLNFIREHVPAAMNIAAGEYGYNLPYFETMLQANAVDILQGDATRCCGISGFIKAGNLCEAYQLPYSSHCAPAMHLHAALTLPNFYIAEYFHDHERIEEIFFDGNPKVKDGVLQPDVSKPGNGLTLKKADAEKYKV
ncbi:MAG TPA: enolase C-terminal domain-like protein [Flavipsychrobacter sp.]|nr:enolase C-terminal domain-like protein [Flavipsychrobacter sp.]